MMTDLIQTVSNRAVLAFWTTEGYKGAFSVPRARLDKSADEAMQTMQKMIASDALSLRGVSPVRDVHGAKLISTVRTRIV